MDGSANLTQTGAHDIHPHTATGEVVGFVFGAKTRVEETVVQLYFGQRFRLTWSDQFLLNRLDSYSFWIDACPIIGDGNHRLVTLVESPERNFPDSWLSASLPYLWRLDPMSQSVVH